KLGGHLVDRSVRLAESDLHDLFGVRAGKGIVERLTKDLHSHLRRDLSGLCTADAISDGEDPGRRIRKIRILVLRPFLVKAAIAYGRRHYVKSLGHYLQGLKFTLWQY